MRSQSERARRKFVTQIWRDLARDTITIATTVNQQHSIIKLTLVQYLVSVDKRNQARKKIEKLFGRFEYGSYSSDDRIGLVEESERQESTVGQSGNGSKRTRLCVRQAA